MLGLLSSLLLAAGFTRAAQQCDPLAIDGRTGTTSLSAHNPVAGCELPCIATNEN
jgi:hypothetical protein